MKKCLYCGRMYFDEAILFCDCGENFPSEDSRVLQEKSQKNLRYGKRWLLGGLSMSLLAILFPVNTGGFLLLITGAAMLVGAIQFVTGWFQAIKCEETLQASHHKLEEFLCNLKMMK